MVGAAILMAGAEWALRRPNEAAQFDLRDWASYLTQSSEPGLIIVRPDQTELYECAVRAFGATRVMYDRRQGSGDGAFRQGRSNGDKRSGANE
jgi:hypothetical protein